jgi:hypothetical protein
MIGLGLVGMRIQQAAQRPLLRKLAGVVVIAFAVHMAYTLARTAASG